ncbi:spermatogenesis-associated protein 20-like isoform X1 [Homarus americanus]|uniref:spermatogenesis-associated protein 20-like isoform X1 n=2 Tax=Homarus americanus TaxID=6706 RepID=UPI001C460E5E|nr:spermatogenesis-associated protein 20-like isoform X1 [Homarus americanus]
MNFCTIGRWVSRVSHQPARQKFQRTMASAGEGASSASSDEQNRLASEKSPYLLQHASNPVHWYPWGDEAFSAARRENKLIFLSVGYSTCHWCHVMERESFENPDIAKIMNANFINVKVDREERPDVDKVYMTFVTSLSGSGGWPMSVWLTPDLNPVYGGTYFPPNNRYFGQPGFPQLLVSLASQWQENEAKFKESGVKIMEVLDRTSRLPAPGTSSMPGEEAVAKCFAQLSSSYEPHYGGFSESPKFPQPSNLNFLFTYHALRPHRDDAKRGLEMALHTLTKMDRGGIHDHVAQGFARYSTDERWHVPHFEKMLYDQAQLTISYLDAYVATGNTKFSDVVRDILTYVMRDLSHPSGGFYSAEDADSLPTADAKEKREGAFCVWTREEITQLLSEPVREGHEMTLDKVFCHHYSVVKGGNVNPYQDPHDELKNQNVLIEHGTVEETSQEFDLSQEECEAALAKAREILYNARQKRPRPHLDDKMLTSWNGMMLGAMVRAGAVLGDNTYIQRAVKAAEFVKSYLYKDDKLLRAAYAAPNDEVSLGSSIEGYADDYAWIIRGFINLYEATLDTDWLELAEALQDKQNELFWDPQGNGYYMTQAGDESILLRIKEDQDGAEPSANSVSLGNLIRLSTILDHPEYRTKAEAIFCLFSDRLNKIPIALPEMTTALLLYQQSPVQIILAGKNGSNSLKEMMHVIHTEPIPDRVFMLADDNQESFMYARHPSLSRYHPKVTDETLAYVCRNFKCLLPVNNPDQLREILKKSSEASGQ